MIHCVDGRSNNSDDYNEESNGDDDNDHLYSTINCNIGDKYDYVMATQSRLFNDNDNEYIQIKTRIELKCLMKTNWLNQTDNQLRNGQIFEANIRQMQPIRIKNSSPSK
ncbi:hypothetical protein DERP_003072 [Dermatophagoides pteronyssinus]|uniref:Uncharacterized protein n=1 Tax=Dermatophagoides pteronyssinus TaxID=6956 RepID=A0ABQ8JJ80_DERPT|nr:hypothetical protein DERP_003072 [Dermatophagoides pteronyssinus]